jgi:DNA (cytosine-5)-methyltransferase 1
MTTAIDLFAGAGGFTEGARMAGVHVAWAANHWPTAVQVHANNHPDTQHICQDLQQADWTQVPRHDLLLASPACQGHSRARGKDKPHHDAARATAWAVVSAAECHRPHAFVVENVETYAEWVLFPAWRMAMEALGYALSMQVLDAADTGVPQNRPRLFVVGVRGRTPLPVPPGTSRHAPVADVLDLGAGTWSLVDRPGRAPNTLARVARGRAQFGRRFVMPYYGGGSGLTGRDLRRPIGTITTRDRWAVVDGDRMRMLRVEEYRAAMGFGGGYHLTGNRRLDIHMLGNAVCPPMAAHVVRHVMEHA